MAATDCKEPFGFLRSCRPETKTGAVALVRLNRWINFMRSVSVSDALQSKPSSPSPANIMA
jgi:hypothetical protein